MSDAKGFDLTPISVDGVAQLITLEAMPTAMHTPDHSWVPTVMFSFVYETFDRPGQQMMLQLMVRASQCPELADAVTKAGEMSIEEFTVAPPEGCACSDHVDPTTTR